MKNILWYKEQADSWIDGLPIGNGRLAAMIWGTEQVDRLSLNHEWLWRGVNRQRDNVPVAEHLDEVRRFLRNGDCFRATCLANVYFAGTGGVDVKGSRVDPYQPAGDLFFQLDNVNSFLRRELDIDAAVAKVQRETTNTTVTSSFIAHPVYNLIIGRWESNDAASYNGTFSGKLYFSRVKDEQAVERYEIYPGKIQYHCSFNGGIRYVVDISIKTDGQLIKAPEGLKVVNATELTAYVNIATSESGMERELEKYAVPNLEWRELLTSHKNTFSSLLRRLELELELPDRNHLPTDERIKAIKEGMEDPTLVLLYFNYGRYLLASSTICGDLPANLQGKWNDNIKPPWDCDYHFDINIQTNYWMAEPANMHECAETLIKYIERMIPHGRKAAKDLYGCRGVYLPLTSDAWGRATPEACGWAAWIGAAPWIAQHFWWHYVYSGDTNFLKNRAYPFFKEIAAFYEDYLVEDEKGILQIMPSQSPENRFKGTGLWRGNPLWPVSIGVSSAMDVQLAYDALGYAKKSAEILKIDFNEIKKWDEMQKKLPAFKIGKDGRLLEWDIERVEVEPGHRHLSHLYGLYPSDLFNPDERPDQYEAAIKSLEYRLSKGGGHTGWSRAWVACLYSRIGKGNKLWEHLCALIKDFTTTSLLDLHPPKIFQIDGNLGAVAAILEGFVQCWGGKIHLLRALPEAWPTGRITGIKAPGGHTLTLIWEDKILSSVEIIIGYARQVILADIYDTFKIKVNQDVIVDGGKKIEVKGKDLIIQGKKGDKFTLYRTVRPSI